MELNITKSREIGAQINAEKKACYRNALTALFSLDNLAGYEYVEGWVLYTVPFVHGWLQNKELGEILDPTLTLNEIQGEIRYFPGVT